MNLIRRSKVYLPNVLIPSHCHIRVIAGLRNIPSIPRSDATLYDCRSQTDSWQCIYSVTWYGPMQQHVISYRQKPLTIDQLYKQEDCSKQEPLSVFRANSKLSMWGKCTSTRKHMRQWSDSCLFKILRKINDYAEMTIKEHFMQFTSTFTWGKANWALCKHSWAQLSAANVSCVTYIYYSICVCV